MPSRGPHSNPSSHLSLSTGGFADSFEGTLIPPPAPEPQAPPPPRQQPLRTPKEVTPPESPSSYFGSRKTSLAGGFGGLTSHPITPIDTRSIEAFPQQGQHAMSTSSNDENQKPGVMNGYHQTQLSGDSSDSNNFDPSLPQQPVKDTSRRPSFISRFMRMRSGSLLRSKSSLGKGDSHTSLSQQQQQQQSSRAPSILAPSERGVKRPGTPTVGGNAPGAPNSNTFPRMMRKKSMELLSTARRKSGMWDRGNAMQDSAVQDERAREQAQEDYMDGVESEHGRKTSEELERERLEEEEDRRRRFEENIRRDPPPTVQLNGINTSTLDGDDMFGNIGK